MTQPSNYTLLLLAAALTSPAQNILYNQDRDKLAKDTLEAARQIASAPLSAAEIRNLATIEQNQIQSAIEWYRITMRSNIQSFRTWRDAQNSINFIAAEIDEREAGLQVAPRVAATAAGLTSRRENLKTQINNLVKAGELAKANAAKTASATTPSSELKIIGERVGQFEELLAFARKVAAGIPANPADSNQAAAGIREDIATTLTSVEKAVKDIQKGIQEVGELATTIETIVSSWEKIRVDPASLAPSPDKIALELLQREAEFIKNLTALRVRRHFEVAETIKLIRRFQAEFQRNRFSTADLDSEITADLSSLAGSASFRGALEQRLRTLLLAAHISARQSGDQTMNDIRESIEFRRYEVSRQSVYNSAYEVALSAAAERLAAYYASGIKPTQVAQLVYQLGTAFTLPYIAVTK
ncbi:MAG: hypothetical protein JST93_36570 [Acidobacteria bacterium]|nr:hypothetical protein [Acidobacteriota bacterium]